MPTNRRRQPLRRRADVRQLTRDQFLDLATGEPYFGGFLDDLDAMADAWDVHRETILETWLQHWPGTRPLAMWLFELVPQFGERKVLDSDSARQYAQARNVRTRGILHTDTIPATQESESDYLDYYQLWEPGERERARAAEGRVPPCVFSFAWECCEGSAA
jgi:hypothetical protein